jgi:hypothetical protein
MRSSLSTTKYRGRDSLLVDPAEMPSRTRREIGEMEGMGACQEREWKCQCLGWMGVGPALREDAAAETPQPI